MRKKKMIIIAAVIAGLTALSFTPGESDESAVQQVVQSFSTLADQQNAEGLDAVLHREFRSIGNQLFGGEQVTITDRKTYLSLIASKTIGGDKRQVTILATDIHDKNAVVKATLKGQKLHFTSYFLLVKNKTGQWKIISDLPAIQ